jgi:hypothetical protein
VKNQWVEIVSIWVVVAFLTIILVVQVLPEGQEVEATFGAILAGSIATVSLIQLFRAEPKGFVRRLVYVGGGSYLILAIATAYVLLRG